MSLSLLLWILAVLCVRVLFSARQSLSVAHCRALFSQNRFGIFPFYSTETVMFSALKRTDFAAAYYDTNNLNIMYIQETRHCLICLGSQ